MVGLRTLTPSVGVRIPLPQPDQKPAYRRAFFVWPEESACGNRSIRWANPGLVRTVGRRGREPSGPRAPGLSSALRSLSPPIGGLSVCRRTGADWRPLGSMGVRRARYRVGRWCVRAAGPGERSAGATEYAASTLERRDGGAGRGWPQSNAASSQRAAMLNPPRRRLARCSGVILERRLRPGAKPKIGAAMGKVFRGARICGWQRRRAAYRPGARADAVVDHLTIPRSAALGDEPALPGVARSCRPRWAGLP